MRRRSAESLARTAALIAVGAFAVHQLRYLAGYGHQAGAELSRQGHGYLAGALPVLGAFLLSAVAAGLLRAALNRRAGGAAAHGSDPFGRRAVLFGVAIATVYLCQESLEGILSAGHPDGIAAVLGHDGWTALLLAAPIGALGALLDRGISTLEVAVAGHTGCEPTKHAAAENSSRPRPPALVALIATPLAFGIACRPPPILARP